MRSAISANRLPQRAQRFAKGSEKFHLSVLPLCSFVSFVVKILADCRMRSFLCGQQSAQTVYHKEHKGSLRVQRNSTFPFSLCAPSCLLWLRFWLIAEMRSFLCGQQSAQTIYTKSTKVAKGSEKFHLSVLPLCSFVSFVVKILADCRMRSFLCGQQSAQTVYHKEHKGSLRVQRNSTFRSPFCAPSCPLWLRFWSICCMPIAECYP
jgi:hypothetical protein